MASGRDGKGRATARRRPEQAEEGGPAMRIRALIVTIAALVGGGLFAIPGAAPANAGIDPARFTNPVANAYFPLKPGTVFVYRGSEGRHRLIEHLRVTHHTKTIEGVKTLRSEERRVGKSVDLGGRRIIKKKKKKKRRKNRNKG